MASERGNKWEYAYMSQR